MCGLFGFFGSHRPNTAILEEIALLAAKRGCDGWGIVTEFTESRDLGRLTAKTVRALPPCRVVVGHCRLATVPDTKRVTACQPIRVGRYVVAHNGSIANADELAVVHGFTLKTGVDSEAIGHLMTIANGSTIDRINWALSWVQHGGHYALAVLDSENMQVHLRAKNIPLYRHCTDDGFYWCSIKPANDWEAVHG